DAWRNSLDHYQEFVIIVALDLKIEEKSFISLNMKKLRHHLLVSGAVANVHKGIFFIAVSYC
ncbi:hypothetical protein, partial [Lacticaseibacillus paracasei]